MIFSVFCRDWIILIVYKGWIYWSVVINMLCKASILGFLKACNDCDKMIESTSNRCGFPRRRVRDQRTRPQVIKLICFPHELTITILARLELLLDLLEVQVKRLTDLPQIIVLFRSNLGLHAILFRA